MVLTILTKLLKVAFATQLEPGRVLPGAEVKRGVASVAPGVDYTAPADQKPDATEEIWKKHGNDFKPEELKFSPRKFKDIK